MTPFRSKVILIRRFEIYWFYKLQDRARDQTWSSDEGCVIEDKIAVVVVTLYRSASVRFKAALVFARLLSKFLTVVS